MFFCSFLTFSQEKEYVKNYYPNGKMKCEGWIENKNKVDYWFYFSEKGYKTSEGHYSKNQKSDWWVFYDNKGNIAKKIEYKKNLPNGLTFIYKMGDLVKAEKYKKGIKIQEWNSIEAFKVDNPFFF